MLPRSHLIRSIALTCITCAVGLTASPAHAQPTAAQQSAVRSNCRSDYMANCASVKPGGIEALQCLQRNVAKLSPGCQSAVNALTPQQATTASASAPPPAPKPSTAAAPAPAAAPAVATSPPAQAPAAASAPPARAATATPAAKPRPAAPARPTAPTLASAPAAVAAPAMPTPQQQSAIRFTCRRDFAANCRGIAPGGMEALACLQRNTARLSPDCRTSLAAIEDGAPAAAPAEAAAPAVRPGPGPLRRALRERLMNQ